MRATWHAQVWADEDGFWHWDVRAPGLRSTGERDTAGEAFAMAQSELEEMRSAAGAVMHGGRNNVHETL